MNHFHLLEERVPSLAAWGKERPYLRLTSRIAGGPGADADVALEDDGDLTVAVTEYDAGGGRTAVCGARFDQGGRMTAWGQTLSQAQEPQAVTEHLALLAECLTGLEETGP